MEKYYKELSQLLPEEKRLNVVYNKDTGLIEIITNNVRTLYGISVRICEYCYKNTLRCYTTWNYNRKQFCLGIYKDD